SATRRASGFSVLPLVADDEGMVQVQMPFEGGLDEQAGTRFAAGAMVRFVVRANEEVIHRKSAPQQVVHAVQLAAGLIATGETGLIRSDNEQKAGGFEFAQSRFGPGLHPKFLKGQRGDLILRSNADFVQNAIPFDKYGSLHIFAKSIKLA